MTAAWLVENDWLDSWILQKWTNGSSDHPKCRAAQIERELAPTPRVISLMNRKKVVVVLPAVLGLLSMVVSELCRRPAALWAVRRCKFGLEPLERFPLARLALVIGPAILPKSGL